MNAKLTSNEMNDINDADFYHSKKLMLHTFKFVVNITLNEHKIKCIDFYIFIFIVLPNLIHIFFV